MCISGLVVEYIVAIDVTQVRFPADAFARAALSCSLQLASLASAQPASTHPMGVEPKGLLYAMRLGKHHTTCPWHGPLTCESSEILRHRLTSWLLL